MGEGSDGTGAKATVGGVGGGYSTFFASWCASLARVTLYLTWTTKKITAICFGAACSCLALPDGRFISHFFFHTFSIALPICGQNAWN